MAAQARFRIKFDPQTIDHLGVRLYSQLPAALNELVTNAYDADSKRVEIAVTEGPITDSSEIIVTDFGTGMTAEEVNEHYLVIGRNRRNEGCATSPGGRSVTGRKGLGKLAAFGVASVMDVVTIKNGVVTAIRLEYAKMRSEKDGVYEPEILPENGNQTEEHSGTRIRLSGLKRQSPMVPADIADGIGRRLLILDHNFRVEINRIVVESAAKKDKGACEDGFYWDVADLPTAIQNAMPEGVTGWFGFIGNSSHQGRGINIYSNGKAVEVNSFFNFAGTTSQFGRAYLVGEVQASFLDGKDDLVSTARDSVVWEDPIAKQFEGWGQSAVKWLLNEWSTKKREQKTDKYMGEDWTRWLDTRDAREQKLAKKLLDLVLNDDQLDAERATPFVDIIKDAVESKAAYELLNELQDMDHPKAAQQLLRLFSDWKIIEAREFHRIFMGRLNAIEQLDRLVWTDAKEVQVMQPLLAQHLWILDPGWKEADREMHYSRLMREHAGEELAKDEADRRLDLFAVSASGRLTIVEVKRANKKLSLDDLSQIESYRRFIRNKLHSSADFAPTNIHALLVVGSMNSELADDVREKRAAGIDVACWSDLQARARKIYEEYLTSLRNSAPEYARRFEESLRSAASS